MIHDLCCKKFNLAPFGDTITKNRIKNKNFNEYPQLIAVINESDSMCVKLNGNDFFDSNSNAITELYKTINFQSFDTIIFLTRINYIDAILSYAYMDPNDSTTWHRKKNQKVVAEPYTISHSKIHHLLNGYLSYNKIKQYILSAVTNYTQIYDYEYDNVANLILKLELGSDIDLVPMDIDYKSVVTNYDEVVTVVSEFVAHHNLFDIN